MCTELFVHRFTCPQCEASRSRVEITMMRSLNTLKDRRRLYWRPRWLQHGSGQFRRNPRSGRVDIPSCSCEKRIWFAYAPQHEEFNRGVTYTHLCAKCDKASWTGSPDPIPEEFPCESAVAKVHHGRRSLELHQASTEDLTTWLEGELEVWSNMEECMQLNRYFRWIHSAVVSRHHDECDRLESRMAKYRDRHNDELLSNAVRSTDRLYRSINHELFPEIAEALITLRQEYSRVPRLGSDCSEDAESRVRSEVERSAESRNAPEPVIASRPVSHPSSGLGSQYSAYVEDGDDNDDG